VCAPDWGKSSLVYRGRFLQVLLASSISLNWALGYNTVQYHYSTVSVVSLLGQLEDSAIGSIAVHEHNAASGSGENPQAIVVVNCDLMDPFLSVALAPHGMRYCRVLYLPSSVPLHKLTSVQN